MGRDDRGRGLVDRYSRGKIEKKKKLGFVEYGVCLMVIFVLYVHHVPYITCQL